jgi:lipoprotein-anchoring transpeptidase ErfK/SrfK
MSREMRVSVVSLCVAVCVGAGSALTGQERRSPTYSVTAVTPDEWKTRYALDQLALLEKLNRRDVEHLKRLTSIVVPDVWTGAEIDYSPFPARWEAVATLPKIIIVDQPMQVFAAFEFGQLVRWGPVSTGRKETPTPAGEYALTWKSKSRVSTDNDQWLLKWYFNFINSRGISFHEFDLPGAAASHACVRMLTRDAEWLYGWGDQWRISKDGRVVEAPGTPVVIHGVVDFSRPTPWTDPAAWLAPIVLPELKTTLPR